MRNGINLCVALISVVAGACAPKNSEWQDLNYSSVYRKAKMRELDTFYTLPSTIGCMDEDLYNCQ